MNKTNTLSDYRPARLTQAGFTLVEIMVGLVIGMIATLVILQVFSVFETQKRATTGTADALTNGNISLFKIERDVEAAGFALMPLSIYYAPLKCAMPLTSNSVPALVTDIFPISATDNIDGTTSDGLTLRYGSSQMGGVPTYITVAGTPVTIGSTLGCNVGDIALVMNKTACSVTSVTAVTPSANSAVPGTVTLASPTNAVAGATLSCLENWHEVTYKVIGTTLMRRDLAGPSGIVFEPLVTGVVNLQVQYGIAAVGLLNNDPKFNTVVQWVDPTGIWAAPTVANRNLIKAIRIAVVTRDAKLEADNVTQACNAASQTGLCAWADAASSPAPTIDLSADANWRRYRYRVFETIIPLRNVNWSKPYL